MSDWGEAGALGGKRSMAPKIECFGFPETFFSARGGLRSAALVFVANDMEVIR